ncbi:hypothetical protein SAZ11_44435 [Streptomyces sp. FXJ1.4098]|nr:hypothetical protein [Streptomyces sp. FXJ1.4098]
MSNRMCCTCASTPPRERRGRPPTRPAEAPAEVLAPVPAVVAPAAPDPSWARTPTRACSPCSPR